MYSLASILDTINPDVYARVIGAAHTHIYTNESISWICKKYGWEKLGEWRFGADIADLLRIIMVKAIANGDEQYAEMCKKEFIPMMDELQTILDRYDLCSDTHVLVKKVNNK